MKQNNNQSQQVPPMTVGRMPKSRYSTLFLIMLIFSSIGAFFSFFGLFSSVFSAVVSFNDGKSTEGILALVSIPIIIMGLVALILLFMKKKIGLIVKLLAISLSLFLSIANITFSKATFVTELKKGISESMRDDQISTEERQLLDSANSFVDKNGEDLLVVFGIIFSSVSAGISILLWSLAWKSQMKHDES